MGETLKKDPVDGLKAARLIEHLAGLGHLDIYPIRLVRDWFLKEGHNDGAYLITRLLEACGEATVTERTVLRNVALQKPNLSDPDLLSGDFFETHIWANPTDPPIRERIVAVSTKVSRGGPPETP